MCEDYDFEIVPQCEVNSSGVLKLSVLLRIYVTPGNWFARLCESEVAPLMVGGKQFDKAWGRHDFSGRLYIDQIFESSTSEVKSKEALTEIALKSAEKSLVNIETMRTAYESNYLKQDSVVEDIVNRMLDWLGAPTVVWCALDSGAKYEVANKLWILKCGTVTNVCPIGADPAFPDGWYLRHNTRDTVIAVSCPDELEKQSDE